MHAYRTVGLTALLGAALMLGLGGCKADESVNRGRPVVPNVPDPTDEPLPADNGYALDAMVGQINGRPVYASQIFQQIGQEQLERLGSENDRLTFKREVRNILANHLRSRISDALIVAEAEASLTEREQMGLLALIQMEREKLIAEAGGYLAGAEANVRDMGYAGIDDYLETKRREKLVDQKYLQEKLLPKIQVTRRDVEAYYRAHPEQFNPPPRIALRMILVMDQDAAEQVSQALESGEAFDAVAQAHSRFKPDDGGFGEFESQLSEFSGFGLEPLNQAVRQLAPGQRSDRIELDNGYAWVKLIDVQQRPGKRLSEVYLDIENRLRAARFHELQREYVTDLLERGNYTPIPQMLDMLVDVAMARYARTN